MSSDEHIKDESLMERISSGDHQAFSSLVQRYTQMFYAAAYRQCGDAQMSEDIVQEAFLKLWQKPEAYDFRRGVKFSTWFYRVVSNLAIDTMRKNKSSRSYVGEAVLEKMGDDGPAQDEHMIMDERQAALEAAIQNLPERQRLALNLCVYEGLSNKEAASVIGVGVKALESLLMRAKAGLKSELLQNQERSSGYG